MSARPDAPVRSASARIETLRRGAGLLLKGDIAPVLDRLGIGARPDAGDDCAVIPDGDGFLLFAIEGFLDSFVAADPFFAGYCGVMVNASDIHAMGGRPVAVVDALWSNGPDVAAALLAGLAFGAETYGVPIVGGHTSARSEAPHLAVAILGRATALLRGDRAAAGDVLLAAIDLRGTLRRPAPWWDASSEAARGGHGQRLRDDLALLPALAEDGLCACAKDISMGGVIGTALMLAEASGIAVDIESARVPCPPGIDPDVWLGCFPSFGFLLAVAPARADAVIARFAARGIACAAIGRCGPGSAVRLDGEVLWDHGAEPLVLPRPAPGARER